MGIKLEEHVGRVTRVKGTVKQGQIMHGNCRPRNALPTEWSEDFHIVGITSSTKFNLYNSVLCLNIVRCALTVEKRLGRSCFRLGMWRDTP